MPSTNHPLEPLCEPLTEVLVEDAGQACVPLWIVTQAEVSAGQLPQPAGAAVPLGAWVQANDFRGERHRVLAVPGGDGALAGVLVGAGRACTGTETQALGERLAPGLYRLAVEPGAREASALALAFGTGSYRYRRYRAPPAGGRVRLLWPRAAERAPVRRALDAEQLARDLINTPAGDLGPVEFAAAIEALAARLGARYRSWVGEELLTGGFPAIHAVGRAAAAAPRLCELVHGDAGPRVTLIGKGVCFDTGGLDLKPASAMALMKKDMGGGACALALAAMLIEARVPLRLRLLVPVVENSVSAAAFRPGDVLATRSGRTVEVGNTDAEGRLILADALTLAAEDEPELIIDLATLTGAARQALGAELPAVFCNRPQLAAALVRHAEEVRDPLWPLPLWDGYDDELASKVAELNNVSAAGQAGAIIAALFLRRFVAPTTAWLHVDLYAWNARERPGRPVGAEMQAVRAIHAWLCERYGTPDAAASQ